MEPLGTDQNKKFLEEAPILIVIFEKKYSIEKNQRIKNIMQENQLELLQEC